MTPFNIYLWQQADSFISLLRPFGFFGFLAAALLIISMIVKLVISIDDPESDFLKAVASIQKGLVIAMVVGFAGSTISAAIPSSKTIALMVALPAIAKSEPIQQDLPELYQLAKEALKDQFTPNK